MYSHKIPFKIRNPLSRHINFLDNLLTVHVFKGEHVGLGGTEPHYSVEVSFGRGAGYPWGRTLYFARDCFARAAWGEEHHDSIHLQYSPTIDISARGRGQGVRLPYQIGWTNNANMVPYVDEGTRAEVPRAEHPAPDDFDYQPGDRPL